jgi:hypothetical protein
MFEVIAPRSNDEVRADLQFASEGFGIYGLAMVLTQVGVPAIVTIPALIVLSGLCARNWLGKRAQLVKVEAAV